MGLDSATFSHHLVKDALALNVHDPCRGSAPFSHDLSFSTGIAANDLPAAAGDFEDIRVPRHDPQAIGRGIERETATPQGEPHARVLQVAISDQREIRRESKRLNWSGPTNNPNRGEELSPMTTRT